MAALVELKPFRTCLGRPLKKPKGKFEFNNNISKKLEGLQVGYLSLKVENMLYFSVEIHMENQLNVGEQNTQQIGQNPISQPVQIPEKPRFNFWIFSTIILAILLLGVLGWYFLVSPQRTATKTNIPEISNNVDNNQLTANNDYTVMKVIVNPTKFEPPNKDQDALRYGYNESVLGKYEADVGILLTSSYQCPKEAISVREYEGSILGSFGIDKAVTYFLPQLDTATCTKDDSQNQYKLYVKWSRRSDTDWTILVPGYSGTENAHREFMMFTENITKDSKSSQVKADELIEYIQNPVTTNVYSLTNNPKITSAPDASFNRNANQIKVLMNFEFGNSCFANVDMELETQIWLSDNTFYVWANPKPKPKSGSGGCPEISSPTKKQVEFFIPIPVDVSNTTVLVPNYPAGKGLPVYIKNIGL